MGGYKATATVAQGHVFSTFFEDLEDLVLHFAFDDEARHFEVAEHY